MTQFDRSHSSKYTLYEGAILEEPNETDGGLLHMRSLSHLDNVCINWTSVGINTIKELLPENCLQNSKATELENKNKSIVYNLYVL